MPQPQSWFCPRTTTYIVYHQTLCNNRRLNCKSQAAAMKKTAGKSSVRYIRVAPDHAGQRLDNYLMAALEGVPRSLVYRLVRTGQVRVNSRRVRPMARLEEGDEVRIPPVAVREPEARTVPDSVVGQIRRNIIAQTEELVVINKPAGVRSEERRVGKECRSWGLTNHEKNIESKSIIN